MIFVPRHRSLLSSQVASTVLSIRKEMGEPFRKGEVLIELDAVIHRANYERARAELISAEAQLKTKESLLVENSISVSEVENARLAVAVARANLVIAQKQYESCTVVAPYDGRVVSVQVNEHESVQTGRPLIEIVDDRVLLAQFLVPSTRLSDIRLGEEIRMEVVETGGKITGKISHIGAVIDPASSAVKVCAEVMNTENILRGGMRGVLILPASPTPSP